MIKSIYILLLITLSINSHSEEYQSFYYSNKEKNLKPNQYQEHRQALITAGVNKDLDEIHTLCDEFEEVYNKPNQMDIYLGLNNLINYYNNSILTWLYEENVNYSYEKEIENITGKSLDHFNQTIGNIDVPIVLIRDYFSLSWVNIASKYPDKKFTYLDKQNNIEIIIDKKWEKIRKEFSNLYCETIGFIERGLDDRYTPQIPKIPLPKIAPNDLNTDIVINQINPDTIINPQLRKEYTDAKEHQKQAALWWSEQRELREYQSRNQKQLYSAIVKLYSQGPDNKEELKDLLNKNTISPEATQRILIGVAIARGESVPEFEKIKNSLKSNFLSEFKIPENKN